MDLRHLRTFRTVCERRSFSQAAEDLDLTQPAVSFQIQALEKHFGTRLLDRGGGRVETTDAGELLLGYAKRILSLAEELEREIADPSRPLEGRLVLGASTGPGEHVLPQLLGEFQRAHPAVTVSLKVADTEAVIDRVQEHGLELGIVGATRPHRSLEFEPFLRDELILIVPPNHRFAERSRVNLADILSEPFILQQEGAGVRLVLERELREHGHRLRDLDVRLELGQQESAKSAVEAGFGISIISSLAVEKELERGSLRTVGIEGLRPYRDFYSVRSAKRTPSRLVTAFLDFARERLAGRAGSGAVVAG